MHLERTYQDQDQERYLHQRSMTISLREMDDLNRAIKESSEQKIEQERDTLQVIFSSLGDGLCTISLNGVIDSVNPAALQILGEAEADLIGRPIQKLFTIHDPNHAHMAELISTGQSCRCSHGSLRHAKGSSIPASYVLNPLMTHETVRGAVLTFHDMTGQLRIEQEQLHLQREIAIAQAALLDELSTPFIPIGKQIMIMPLIGTIDSKRLEKILQTLLNGITEYNARRVIIDITGVSLIDTHVANGLIHAAQATRLLGARAIITGVRPEVAQTLVSLGVDLSQIETRSNLRDAIMQILW